MSEFISVFAKIKLLQVLDNQHRPEFLVTFGVCWYNGWKGDQIFERFRELIIAYQLGIQSSWIDCNWDISNFLVRVFAIFHAVCIFLFVVPGGGVTAITVIYCSTRICIIHVISVIILIFLLSLRQRFCTIIFTSNNGISGYFICIFIRNHIIIVWIGSIHVHVCIIIVWIGIICVHVLLLVVQMGICQKGCSLTSHWQILDICHPLPITYPNPLFPYW